ncbi:hypothetical protein [Halorarius halobius]|nr:hypothetical protein [Halorarius halobius]
MPRCARCEAEFSPTGEWIEVTHNHAHMRFDSAFCSPECAVTYLENGL